MANSHSQVMKSNLGFVADNHKNPARRLGKKKGMSRIQLMQDSTNHARINRGLHRLEKHKYILTLQSLV